MAEEESPAKPSKSRVILIAALGITLIAALGGAGGWYFLGGDGETSVTEEQGQQEVKARAIYIKLRTVGGKPAFISNFYEASGRQRFMQIYAEARTRSSVSEEALRKHMPLVVHSLNTLFSNQDFTDMQTDEGRQRLRQEATAKVQDILQSEIGEPGIEEVFFTNFVMQ